MTDSPEEKKEKLSSMSAAVKIVIDAYPISHVFYGNELKDDVVRIYPDAINMYPDTILKMARRHRRDSYISIDRNNSLYKRVKSNYEIALELAEKKLQEENEKKYENAQEQLQLEFPSFSYAFFVVFFTIFLGLLFNGESAFGCPLTDRCFSISISASESSYIALTPIYRFGVYPARSNLLRVASVDTGFFGVLIFWQISKTVNNSITPLYKNKYTNQVENVEKSDILPYLLYGRVVIFSKFSKFYENSFQNLDNSLRRA